MREFAYAGRCSTRLRKLDWAPCSVHRKRARRPWRCVRSESRVGEEASDTEVAQQMGVPLPEYQQILRDALGCQLLRLDEAEDGEESQLDHMPITAPMIPEGIYGGTAAAQGAGGKGTKSYLERERLVLSLYYEQELNLKEIGAILKVTESRVCQLHGQALLRLKGLLAEWYH